MIGRERKRRWKVNWKEDLDTREIGRMEKRTGNWTETGLGLIWKGMEDESGLGVNGTGLKLDGC